MSLGITEIILILLAVVILFGGKKIPELARALGRASHEFKKAKQTIENEVREISKAAEEEEKNIAKSSAVEQSAGKNEKGA